MFEALKNVDGFYMDKRVTIVDQENIIDKTYRRTIKDAKLSLYMLHGKNNMRPILVLKRGKVG